MRYGLLFPIILTAVAGASGWLLWQLPKMQLRRVGRELSATDRIDQETKARAVLAQIFGGLALLFGLYFTWKSYDLSRTSQLSDRFSNAAKLLDKQWSVPARVGAITSLRQLADESPEFRWPVMDLLAAYVREESPWLSDPQFEACRSTAAKHRNEGEGRAQADIQAALDVLKQQDWRHSPHSLDLRNVNLRGADLSEGNFVGALFNFSYMGWVDLSHSHLEGAHLIGVCIPEPEFSQCAEAWTKGVVTENAKLDALAGCLRPLQP